MTTLAPEVRSLATSKFTTYFEPDQRNYKNALRMVKISNDVFRAGLSEKQLERIAAKMVHDHEPA